MPHPLRATHLIAFAVAFTACKDPPADGAPMWEVAQAVDDASVSGVWGSGPTDVWAVGGDDAGGRAWRFDGAAWSELTLPEGTPLLVWAYGFGPDDVWMAGESGACVHVVDGTATLVDVGVDRDLWGVWGTSASDLWMVGGETGGAGPVTVHGDGSTWTEGTLDAAANTRAATALFKVWGVDGDVFAVGEAGLIVRRDGDAWVNTPTGADADEDFVSLWGDAADHIVAVGGRNSPRIARWDGASWTTSKPDPTAVKPLNAVFMQADGTTLIGGLYGFVGTYDPATDAVTAEAVTTDLAIHAMWGDDAGTTWAVGGTFAAPHRGTILRRTEGGAR